MRPARPRSGKQGLPGRFEIQCDSFTVSDQPFERRQLMILEADIEAIRARIDMLVSEHHNLDATISKMSQSQVYNDEQLHQLKKKKLHLKDQIATLERRLHAPPTH